MPLKKSPPLKKTVITDIELMRLQFNTCLSFAVRSKPDTRHMTSTIAVDKKIILVS